LLIPDPDPTIAPSRIPDPVGKNAPDPGSGTLRYTIFSLLKFFIALVILKVNLRKIPKWNLNPARFYTSTKQYKLDPFRSWHKTLVRHIFWI
jgi:hypothetical protein